MNLAIIGSRCFSDYDFAKETILNIIKNNNYKIDKIISGGAIGSDTIAELFSNEYKIPIHIIKPDWSLGKYAGFLRNSDIINNSDIVIAFWDNKSKGTLDSINKAKKLNKSLFIIYINKTKVDIQLPLF